MKNSVLVSSIYTPEDGYYYQERLTPAAFFGAVEKAAREDQLIQRIAYPENLRIINEFTGLKLQTSASAFRLDHGDELLVMRLDYDPKAKPERRKNVTHEDFIYSRVKYTEAHDLPILPRSIIEDVESLEPDKLTFIVNYLVTGFGADRAALEAQELRVRRAERAGDTDQLGEEIHEFLNMLREAANPFGNGIMML